jgi:hypothetical protein
MGKEKDPGRGIWDKHPGSATLLICCMPFKSKLCEGYHRAPGDENPQLPRRWQEGQVDCCCTRSKTGFGTPVCLKLRGDPHMCDVLAHLQTGIPCSVVSQPLRGCTVLLG